MDSPSVRLKKGPLLLLAPHASVHIIETDDSVVKDILAAVKDGGSAEHVAQRARDAKERQQAHDDTGTALTEAGVTVIDRPDHNNRTIKHLRELRLLTKNGTPKAKAPTEAEHECCPGHAAYVTVETWVSPMRARSVYVCTDPRSNGHALYSYQGTTLPGDCATGPMSEQQKAERRTLIANNKAWDSV